MDATIISVVADCQSDFNISCFTVDYVFIKHSCKIPEKHLNMHQITLCARKSLGGRIGGV